MTPILSKNAPAPIGPYSQGIQTGNMIFLSGQVAIDTNTGNMINETISEETTQVMLNIDALLKEAGLNFSNVVKCSIFLKDLNDFEQVNTVYASYFNAPFPARECVQVSRLPKDAHVEISVIAAIS